MYQLIVNRKDFHDFRISKTTPESLEDGQILVKINQFAFTSNNITYAAVGEKVGYWNFFPVSEVLKLDSLNKLGTSIEIVKALEVNHNI
ncbi:MAG TPA: DUF2855 family protein [Chitinophagales bacterium]|nr:DUF2855 family protein [Chitinophagales bacterium]